MILHTGRDSSLSSYLQLKDHFFHLSLVFAGHSNDLPPGISDEVVK